MLPLRRIDLLKYFDNLLQPSGFKDYGPNGLQVEGREVIRHVVFGVTASQALIDAAVAESADAIVVHHGLFWRSHDGKVCGWMKQRLHTLLIHDISLFAYHLPLDAHPEVGNTIQLARLLGLPIEGSRTFGEQSVASIFCWDGTLGDLAERARSALCRPVTVVAAHDRPIRQIAICTGGGQSYFESTIEAGADAFITGEISEPQTHIAREMGVHYLACGHHATERYGVQALGRKAARDLMISFSFIDIENPA